ncbi:MAG: VWA domain-containing protein [Phycisphaerae bacterium]|nr:VWA domain-containing protein [Phycisphaerae bacterium]
MLLAARQVEREVLEFAALPDGWLRLLGLLVPVALCGAAIWMYRRERRVGAEWLVREVLAALRCLVLMILVVIALRPVLVTYVERTTAARTVVLVDESASMDVRDVGDGDTASSVRPSRGERVRELLEANDYAWLRRLADHNEVSLHAFGQTTVSRPLPWDTASPTRDDPNTASLPIVAIAPDAGGTDLGQSIQDTCAPTAGQPIAGVVVLTDGAINRGMSVGEIAAYLRHPGIAVFAVGVGDTEEPPNVRISGLAAPTAVPRGDPFEVRVDLGVNGFEAAELEVSLGVVEMSGGVALAEREVATRRVTVDEAAEPVLFTVDPGEGGQYVYRARVQPLASEVNTEDNTRATPVRVLDDQLRVLIVAGHPSYDYRYLTRLLERDNTVELSCWLQSANAQAVRDGNKTIVELPREPSAVFAYDALILLDPNPDEFDAAWGRVVRRFVDEFGGGLLYQAGTHFAARFVGDERLADLVAALPVVADPEAGVLRGGGGAFHTRSSRLSVPDAAREHPVTALSGDAQTNQLIWSALPATWWTFPVRRVKPLAQPLLVPQGSETSESPHDPVLVVQPFGAGRTAFLGTDGTWRWRATGEAYYNRFWVQLVRYLADARRRSTSSRGTIVLDRDVVATGTDVRVEARVLDEQFMPLASPEIALILEAPDGSTGQTTLTAITGRDGWYAGRISFNADGVALLRVMLPGGTDDEVLMQYLRVQRPDLEMRSVRMRADELRELAERTGGQFVPIADAGALPNWIESAAETRTERGPRRDLWDRWWVMAVLAVLLATEWAVRRRCQLL